jgi:hypothetical protein
MAPPLVRSTHTFAILLVSRRTFEEIARKLREAGHEQAFNDVIDMHGIAIQIDPQELPGGPG